MSFVGKVALITGAASGIGADVARHLAKLGAQVSIIDRNGKNLHKITKQIENSGAPDPLPIIADVTKDSQRITDETIDRFGKLDILITSAGIGTRDNIYSINQSEFTEILNTNLQSVISLTKLCVPHLEKTKGNIINVSSVAGIKVCPNTLSFCMSKAALDQFTKCCALDLAPKRIRVNAINPAAIRTPIFGSLEDVEKVADLCKLKVPLGRIGEVSDTTAAIAFLASDEASFLTGLLLPVEGGFLMAVK